MTTDSPNREHLLRDGACSICGQLEADLEPSCPRTRDWTIPTRDAQPLALPPGPRSLRVDIDRCRGCCFCGNASVPHLRLCRHPLLERPVPITQDELDAPASPGWCPARGLVVLAAGLPPVAQPPPLPVTEPAPPPDDGGVALAGYCANYGPDAAPSARRHIVVGTVAACDHSMVLTTVGPAALVPVERRCRRGPCRVAWLEGSPHE